MISDGLRLHISSDLGSTLTLLPTLEEKLVTGDDHSWIPSDKPINPMVATTDKCGMFDEN
jgi:hypothetical protein